MKQLQHETEYGKSPAARLTRFKDLLECDRNGKPTFSLKPSVEYRLAGIETGFESVLAKRLLHPEKRQESEEQKGKHLTSLDISVTTAVFSAFQHFAQHKTVSELLVSALGLVTSMLAAKLVTDRVLKRRHDKEEFVDSLESLASTLRNPDTAQPA